MYTVKINGDPICNTYPGRAFFKVREIRRTAERLYSCLDFAIEVCVAEESQLPDVNL